MHPESLIIGFNNGDTLAFKSIYDQLYQGLLFYACDFVQLDKAEDVVAETFVKLWDLRHVNRFSALAEIKKWVRVTARNGCIDLLRSEKRNIARQQEWSYLNENEYNQEYFLSSVEESFFFLLTKAIEELDPQRKTIFKMSFLKGMSNDEIAEELRISRQTVKNTKVKALQILREVLDPAHWLISLYLLISLYSMTFF